jgi:tellurite resistance-related uncharacterized protein
MGWSICIHCYFRFVVSNIVTTILNEGHMNSLMIPKGQSETDSYNEESISRNFNTSLSFNKHNGVYVKLNILNSNVSFYHHASSAILILSSDNSFFFHSVVNGTTMCRYSKLYLWNTLNVHAYKCTKVHPLMHR